MAGGFAPEKYADQLGVWCVWHTTLLFQIWEDSYQRVATQQEIYEGPWQWCSVLIPMGAGEGPASH